MVAPSMNTEVISNERRVVWTMVTLDVYRGDGWPRVRVKLLGKRPGCTDAQSPTSSIPSSVRQPSNSRNLPFVVGPSGSRPITGDLQHTRPCPSPQNPCYQRESSRKLFDFCPTKCRIGGSKTSNPPPKPGEGWLRTEA